MLQADFLAMLRQAAVDAKEHACKRRPQDITTMMVVYRGEELVAQIMLGQSGRENFLRVFAFASAGFDADAMGMVFESYLAGVDPATGQTYLQNPLTGQDWGYDGDRGGMQVLAEEHDGVAKGWVRECVSISAINRAGDHGFISLPYAYVGGRYLSWHARDEVGWRTSENDKAAVEGGFLTERMRHVMRQPSASQIAPGTAITREEKDLVVARALTRAGNAVVLFASAGSERAATIGNAGMTLPLDSDVQDGDAL